jgi:hypothetical protein
MRISWSIGANTYCYLKCIVYDKLLKPRQSFSITLYSHLCLVLLVGCPNKALYSFLYYPILPHSSFISSSLISSPYVPAVWKMFVCLFVYLFVCYCIMTMMTNEKRPIILESFIYPTDAQLDCSKRMLKFTWEVLLHVSVFHKHHQGATVCVLLKVISINNESHYAQCTRHTHTHTPISTG